MLFLRAKFERERHLPLAAMMFVERMSLDFSDLIVAAASPPLAAADWFSDI